jgi:hypothetical protein
MNDRIPPAASRKAVVCCVNRAILTGTGGTINENHDKQQTISRSGKKHYWLDEIKR